MAAARLRQELGDAARHVAVDLVQDDLRAPLHALKGGSRVERAKRNQMSVRPRDFVWAAMRRRAPAMASMDGGGRSAGWRPTRLDTMLAPRVRCSPWVEREYEGLVQLWYLDVGVLGLVVLLCAFLVHGHP